MHVSMSVHNCVLPFGVPVVYQQVCKQVELHLKIRTTLTIVKSISFTISQKAMCENEFHFEKIQVNLTDTLVCVDILGLSDVFFSCFFCSSGGSFQTDSITTVPTSQLRGHMPSPAAGAWNQRWNREGWQAKTHFKAVKYSQGYTPFFEWICLHISKIYLRLA